MTTQVRIELDGSRLLGFRQGKGALPDRLARQQAKVCPAPPLPEPSAWAELLLGLLMLAFFALRSRYQKKKAQPGAIAPSPAVFGSASAPSSKE